MCLIILQKMSKSGIISLRGDIVNEKSFEKEFTTVWSFPERGNWKTHNSKYRGNFAPQVPRNIILNYSKEGDFIVDPMMGSGTSLIEAKLLNRRSIGVDINPNSIRLAKNKIKFKGNYKYKPAIYQGDVRNLDFINSNSIDLIITHPPYFNIINYSQGKIENDLSTINDLKKFLKEFSIAITEFFRILKENAICAILIGDTRKNSHYIPLSNYILNIFLKKKFILKDEIIKIQHNCKQDEYWRNKIKKYNFYLIKHEHLFIFRKPNRYENLKKYKYSSGLNI